MANKELADGNEKLARHKAILDVIEAEEPGTQEDLVAAVRKRGFVCTQTTISRDLAEMNVVKVGRVYRPLADVHVGALERSFNEHALTATSAGPNLVVLKTRPGSAQTVAIEMDRARWKEIVGTLAGDDTIFVAVADKPSSEAVLRKLKRLLPAGGE